MPNPKKRIVALCEVCNKEFEYLPSQKRGKYCSNGCAGEGKYLASKEKIEAGETKVSLRPLKRWLIETRGNRCEICGIAPHWNGKSLSMQMDHVDGDSDNNHHSNVRLLCPNCHSQTDTFGSKGKGSRYKKTSKRNLYLQAYKGKK